MLVKCVVSDDTFYQHALEFLQQIPQPRNPFVPPTLLLYICRSHRPQPLPLLLRASTQTILRKNSKGISCNVSSQYQQKAKHAVKLHVSLHCTKGCEFNSLPPASQYNTCCLARTALARTALTTSAFCGFGAALVCKTSDSSGHPASCGVKII